MYTYIPISPPSCVSLPPSLSHPSRWSQSTELISLSYRVLYPHFLPIIPPLCEREGIICSKGHHPSAVAAFRRRPCCASSGPALPSLALSPLGSGRQGSLAAGMHWEAPGSHGAGSQGRSADPVMLNCPLAMFSPPGVLGSSPPAPKSPEREAG